MLNKSWYDTRKRKFMLDDDTKEQAQKRKVYVTSTKWQVDLRKQLSKKDPFIP